MAEHCLPSIMKTLFAWYERQGVEWTISDYTKGKGDSKGKRLVFIHVLLILMHVCNNTVDVLSQFSKPINVILFILQRSDGRSFGIGMDVGETRPGY